MHGSITGIHYQDLSGKIPKIPDFYYNSNHNGHLFNAACPAPAVNWQIVQQANGAPPALTPVDLNGNSPLFTQQASAAAITTLSGVGAGHQNWAVIGDDTTTTSNNDGGRETPQTPTYMMNGGHQSRWAACFPPPSILPLWCITSSSQNRSKDLFLCNVKDQEIVLNATQSLSYRRRPAHVNTGAGCNIWVQVRVRDYLQQNNRELLISSCNNLGMISTSRLS
uniref:Uncharacterized protein n=1 Tax=Romanomermis culicivorax TaxID=13658 RepID=A0A915KJ01_ROMCU